MLENQGALLVIPIDDEAEPQEIVYCEITFCEFAEYAVEVGYMIERAPLAKHRDIRERLVARYDMMKVGVRLTTLIWKVNDGRSWMAKDELHSILVVDCDGHFAGDAAQPFKVLLVSCNYEFVGHGSMLGALLRMTRMWSFS